MWHPSTITIAFADNESAFLYVHSAAKLEKIMLPPPCVYKL